MIPDPQGQQVTQASEGKSCACRVLLGSLDFGLGLGCTRMSALHLMRIAMRCDLSVKTQLRVWCGEIVSVHARLLSSRR